MKYFLSLVIVFYSCLAYSDSNSEIDVYFEKEKNLIEAGLSSYFIFDNRKLPFPPRFVVTSAYLEWTIFDLEAQNHEIDGARYNAPLTSIDEIYSIFREDCVECEASQEDLMSVGYDLIEEGTSGRYEHLLLTKDMKYTLIIYTSETVLVVKDRSEWFVMHLLDQFR